MAKSATPIRPLIHLRFVTLLSCACHPVSAQDPTAAAQEPRPALEQLTRETQALYAEVQGGVLRVELPPPRWLGDGAAGGASGNGGDHPLTKYRGLDPRVREHLALRVVRTPAAYGRGPATRPETDAGDRPDATALVVIPPPQPATQQAGAKGPADATAHAFTPNNIGLVLDERGHLLVPLYLEAEAAGRMIRVGGADGATHEARVVGSDRQTNLTVLRVAGDVGRPLRLSEEDPPAAGAVVMLLTPHDASARIGLWTGPGRDYAVVFATDGRCAGVARFGQFLSGRACRLIAAQIIRHGTVRRATLGVIVTQVAVEDAAGGVGGAGPRSAMRVDQVMPGSAAEQAGLRVGDRVVSLAGEPVTDLLAMSAAIAARDGPTTVRVLREGQPVEVTVDLRRK